jgi:ABC-type glycerol-3-phosphate transport system substrate-binding protein
MKTLRTLLLLCVVAGSAACGSDTTIIQPDSSARFDGQPSDTTTTKTERGGGYAGSGG